MPKKFVMYEVWTVAHVIEAESEEQAYAKYEPLERDEDMSLCNWHAVEVDEDPSDPDAVVLSSGFDTHAKRLVEAMSNPPKRH